MPKRLNPIEKDKIMRGWLNRMRINQVHKGVLMANKVFTWNQLTDSDAHIDGDTLVMGDRRYFIVEFDRVRLTLVVRELSNEQDS